jgi:hypothetical protein
MAQLYAPNAQQQQSSESQIVAFRGGTEAWLDSSLQLQILFSMSSWHVLSCCKHMAAEEAKQMQQRQHWGAHCVVFLIFCHSAVFTATLLLTFWASEPGCYVLTGVCGFGTVSASAVGSQGTLRRKLRWAQLRRKLLCGL